MKETLLNILSAVLASLIFLAFAYGAMFAVLYFTADEVECGSVGLVPYCTGVYHIDTEIQKNISVESTCYRNGAKVNCSQLEAYNSTSEAISK